MRGRSSPSCWSHTSRPGEQAHLSRSPEFLPVTRGVAPARGGGRRVVYGGVGPSSAHRLRQRRRGLSIAGCRSRVVDRGLPIAGCRSRVADRGLPIAGCRSRVVVDVVQALFASCRACTRSGSEGRCERPLEYFEVVWRRVGGGNAGAGSRLLGRGPGCGTGSRMWVGCLDGGMGVDGGRRCAGGQEHGRIVSWSTTLIRGRAAGLLSLSVRSSARGRVLRGTGLRGRRSAPA
jgi:hypothetical protein